MKLLFIKYTMIINRLLFVHSERFNYNVMFTTLKLLYWHELTHRIFYDTVFYEFKHVSNVVVNVQIMTEFTDKSADENKWNKDLPANFQWDSDELVKELAYGADNGKFCLNHLTTKNPIKGDTLGAAFTRGMCLGMIGGFYGKPYSRNVGFSSLSTMHTYIPEPVSLSKLQLSSLLP